MWEPSIYAGRFRWDHLREHHQRTSPGPRVLNRRMPRQQVPVPGVEICNTPIRALQASACGASARNRSMCRRAASRPTQHSRLNKANRHRRMTRASPTVALPSGSGRGAGPTQHCLRLQRFQRRRSTTRWLAGRPRSPGRASAAGCTVVIHALLEYARHFSTLISNHQKANAHPRPQIPAAI